jgi:hypothetical protein
LNVNASWRLFVQSDAAWIAARPEFYFDDLGRVYEPPAFAARAALGVALRF